MSATPAMADHGRRRVLSITTVFPNPVQPSHGLFVRQRLQRLARSFDLHVVAPVPYFPGCTGRLANRPAGVPKRSSTHEIEAEHPRFWSPPGLGKSLDGWLYAASIAPLVGRLHALHRFELIDAHFAYPDGFAAVAIGRWLNLPVTITLRGTLSDLKRRPSCRWALRRALRHADAVVSVSRSLRDDAVELGISADRIDVIPNGIDADLFAPMARQQAREQLGLPSNARVLLTVGALRHVKGHDLLLRAFARLCFGDGARSNGVAGAPGSGDQVGGGTTTPEGLPERGQKLRLVVLGGRSISDDRSRELRDLARELGLGDRVVWAGAVAHSEVPRWLAAADVFTLASRREGCCNAVLEALACGRPAVVTAVGGNPETITGEHVGYLVPPEDPEALAAALDRALGRRWDEQSIRDQVKRRSWDAVSESVGEVWQRTLSAHALSGERRREHGAATARSTEAC